MKAKLMSESGVDGARVFAVVFDPGEEVARGLADFTKLNGIRTGHFSGIGAFSRATLAWFSREDRRYEQIPIEEQVEVLSIQGNVTIYEGEQRIHAHVVVSKRDGSAVGGHLIEGYIWPTLEMVIYELPIEIERKNDEDIGLPMISL